MSAQKGDNFMSHQRITSNKFVEQRRRWRTDWAVWFVVLPLLFVLFVSTSCVFPPLGPRQTPTPPVILSPVAITPATVPVLAIAPVARGVGATIFVSGAGWQP